MVIVCPKFLRFITNGFAKAMAIYPFILLQSKDLEKNAVLMNHERIHHKQQLEMLFIGFYIWYVLEYLFHRIKSKNHNTAYRSISFEKEAYLHESDLNYLHKRKWYAWRR